MKLFETRSDEPLCSCLPRFGPVWMVMLPIWASATYCIACRGLVIYRAVRKRG